MQTCKFLISSARPASPEAVVALLIIPSLLAREADKGEEDPGHRSQDPTIGPERSPAPLHEPSGEIGAEFSLR